MQPSLLQAAQKLNVPAQWLYDVIKLESNHNPKAKNAIGAVGLIQFVTSTARDLGTTTSKILAMSYDEQMNLVVKYLQKAIKARGKVDNFLDFYSLVFYPAMVNKPLNYKLPAKAYKANIALDMNKDGQLTKSDFKQWIEKRLGKSVTAVQPTPVKDGPPKWAFPALFISILLLWLYA